MKLIMKTNRNFEKSYFENAVLIHYSALVELKLLAPSSEWDVQAFLVLSLLGEVPFQ